LFAVEIKESRGGWKYFLREEEIEKFHCNGHRENLHEARKGKGDFTIRTCDRTWTEWGGEEKYAFSGTGKVTEQFAKGIIRGLRENGGPMAPISRKNLHGIERNYCGRGLRPKREREA